jgi:flagellar hook-associated protein FlgK
VQTQGGGGAASLTVAGGSALAALGWGAGQTTSGSAHAVEVALTGAYTGAANALYTFVPSADGTIGTTAGLTIAVHDASGAQVATLAVGAGYQPGTALALGNGLSVSFGYGEVSASDNDAFAVHALADADTSDALVALGLNSFYTGSTAGDIALSDALADDPALLAGSYTGAAGDNGALLALAKLSEQSVGALGGETLGAYHDALVADLGFEVAAAKEAHEVEELLAASLEARRSEVSGVNLDEELVRMVELEQAYAAAAQLIQVVNQLHDELLGML